MDTFESVFGSASAKALGLAYGWASSTQGDLHRRWVDLSHRIASYTSAAFIAPVQGDGDLDMLIRVMEAADAAELQKPEGVTNLPPYANLKAVLGRAFVLSAYETIRVAAHSPAGAEQARLQALLHKLELLRMPLAKGEIARTDRKNAPPITVVREGDDPATQAHTYDRGNVNYIMPAQVRLSDGSEAWIAIDVQTRTTPLIYRRDLADEMLALFD